MLNNIKTVVVLPDIHFAPSRNGMEPIDGHDVNAVSIALQIIKDLKPDEVVQLGDMLDFGAISPFNKNKDMMGIIKSDDGRSFRACMGEYFDLGNRFLNEIGKASKGSKITLLEGNHERWLVDMAHTRTYEAVSDDWNLVDRLNLDERKIDLYPYGGQTSVFRHGVSSKKPNYYQIGKLKIGHGYYHSANTFLQKHYQDMYMSSFIIGHLHTIACKSFTTALGNHIGWCIGTLSKMTPSYMRGMPNAWNQAIAVVRFFPNGNFFVNCVPIVKGVAMLGNKVYKSKELKGF